MVNPSESAAAFRDIFPESTPTLTVRAPGRVNLIGEHVDYLDGFVLPIAMSQALTVTAGPSDDGNVVVKTTIHDEPVCFPASDPGPPGEPAWGNYVRGVAAMLIRESVSLRPGRLLIASDVPVGGGVSSSAALEVGTALALLGLAGESLDPVPLALLARRAEHEYAKSPCGIMDQFICVLGRADHALLLDCRSRQTEQIPFRLDDAELLVMNTQVKHEIGSSEYPVRQRQCAEGLAVLRAAHPSIEALRDVTPAMLEGEREHLDTTAYHRCRHAVSEIARTQRAADALRAGDLTTFGQLMLESHESLRDDYGVSCDELDALVEIARSIPGVYGARMTGGGFGGCAIALVRHDAADPLRSAIDERYDTHFDRPAIVYPTRAADGAAVNQPEARARNAAFGEVRGER